MNDIICPAVNKRDYFAIKFILQTKLYLCLAVIKQKPFQTNWACFKKLKKRLFKRQTKKKKKKEKKKRESSGMSSMSIRVTYCEQRGWDLVMPVCLSARRALPAVGGVTNGEGHRVLSSHPGSRRAQVSSYTRAALRRHCASADLVKASCWFTAHLAVCLFDDPQSPMGGVAVGGVFKLPPVLGYNQVANPGDRGQTVPYEKGRTTCSYAAVREEKRSNDRNIPDKNIQRTKATLGGMHRASARAAPRAASERRRWSVLALQSRENPPTYTNNVRWQIVSPFRR